MIRKRSWHRLDALHCCFSLTSLVLLFAGVSGPPTLFEGDHRMLPQFTYKRSSRCGVATRRVHHSLSLSLSTSLLVE